MAALLLFGPILATPGSKYLCIESAANLHDILTIKRLWYVVKAYLFYKEYRNVIRVVLLIVIICVGERARRTAHPDGDNSQVPVCLQIVSIIGAVSAYIIVALSLQELDRAR